MRVLALDSSLQSISIALMEGNEVRAGLVPVNPGGHGGALEVLPGMLDALLAECGVSLREIHRIVVTCGPGRYAGLRVALAVARGIAVVTGCKVLGLSTLSAFVRSVFGPSAVSVNRRDPEPGTEIYSVAEAGRGNFYIQGYSISHGDLENTGPCQLLTRREIESPHSGLLISPGAALKTDRPSSGPVLIGTQANRLGSLLFPAGCPGAASGEEDLSTGSRGIVRCHELRVPDIRAIAAWGAVADPAHNPPDPIYGISTIAER